MILWLVSNCSAAMRELGAGARLERRAYPVRACFVRGTQLGAEDSGLTIEAHTDGRQGRARAILSGGVPLSPRWAPSQRCHAPGCLESNLAGQVNGSILGLRVDGRRAIRARYPNADPETA